MRGGALKRIRAAVASGARTRAWILRTVGRRGLASVAVLAVLQSLLAGNGVALALVMQRAVDAAVAREPGGFWLACGLFAGVLVTQVVLRAANRALLERTRSAIENRLRARAFVDVLAQPYAQAERRHTGDAITRMTSDASVVADAATTLVPTMVSMAVRLVGVVAALFALVPGMAAVLVAGGCAAAVASAAARPLLKRLHARMQAAEGTMRSYLQDCLDSLLVVHAFGRERKVEREADAAMTRHRAARVRKADVSNGLGSALSLAVQAAYVLGFVWCGAGILAGTVTYGTLMAVVQLIGQIQSPFTMIGGSFSRYSAMLASAERLMELGAGANGFIEPHEDARGVGGAPLVRIELRDVRFSYDRGGEVLRGCSLDLRLGDFIGLAGESGAGKSTLMKVLLGAYDPSTGVAAAVFAGTRPLGEEDDPSAGATVRASDDGGLPDRGRDLPHSAVPLSKTRGLFAYVPQGNRLMAGSIRDVVAFSEDGEPDDGRVWEALRVADADGFVRALPEGLSTRLGQRGSGLSEGQMQRIAVARAVYSAAPVLLLDEATSALDARTEHALLANLRQLKGRAVVMVTHREATLAACDRVLKLDGGVLREVR